MMNANQALEIIKEATEPASAGRITRSGYAMIEKALAVIESAILRKDEIAEKEKEKDA